MYCWTSASAQITGALTLSGPAGSVWVFQLATSLTVASGASITISGGANACNVVWAIGSAIFGTTAAVQGTFLCKSFGSSSFGLLVYFSLAHWLIGSCAAYATIAVATGATVSGRLVSSTAAVTLDSNTIDSSACVPNVIALASACFSEVCFWFDRPP